MGLLATALQPRAYAPHDDYWFEPRYAPSSPLATPNSALTVSSFYACTAVISDDIAKVPLNVFEDLGDAGHRISRNHPLADKLRNAPNRYQTALEWRAMMTAFALLRKFGISEIRPGPRPLVDDEYVPLHPDLVKEETLRSGERVYRYRDPLKGFAERTLTDDQVVILRGRFGRSVLDFAAQSMGTALSQERHADNLFARGALFQGAIMRDKPWNDTERGNFRKALDEYAAGGQYSGRPLLLEDGMTWQSISLTAQQAELIDSRRFSTIQACQWFRIPPHKIFELERATFSNIEHQSVEYVTDSLLFWAENWEQVIWRDLIVAKGRFFAEHNLDGLLRGDFQARSQGYALAIMWGWMSRNEVRRRENLNPIQGLDDVLTPVNMTVGDGAEARVEYSQPKLLPSGDRTPALLGRLKLHASSAAARVVRREVAELQRLAERTGGDEKGWREGVEAFYAKHPEHVAAALHVPEPDATRYAQAQRDDLLEHGPAVLSSWLIDRVETLTDLAMNQEAIAA